LGEELWVVLPGWVDVETMIRTIEHLDSTHRNAHCGSINFCELLVFWPKVRFFIGFIKK
jgi:hypothetical protein